MTATGSADGEQRDYADIAEAMRDLSRSPRQDHHALFDRVVASVVLGNTDDHLRNHGFLADRGSWELSPVFDVNPNPDVTKARATSIAGSPARSRPPRASPNPEQPSLFARSPEGRDRLVCV